MVPVAGVALEVRALAEADAAEVALERLLLRVRERVPAQVVRAREAHAALVALVGPLAGVRQLVPLQVAGRREEDAAQRAAQRLVRVQRDVVCTTEGEAALAGHAHGERIHACALYAHAHCTRVRTIRACALYALAHCTRVRTVRACALNARAH